MRAGSKGEPDTAVAPPLPLVVPPVLLPALLEPAVELPVPAVLLAPALALRRDVLSAGLAPQFTSPIASGKNNTGIARGRRLTIAGYLTRIIAPCNAYQ